MPLPEPMWVTLLNSTDQESHVLFSQQTIHNVCLRINQHLRVGIKLAAKQPHHLKRRVLQAYHLHRALRALATRIQAAQTPALVMHMQVTRQAMPPPL